MSRAKRHQDMRAAKERRQKQIVIGGAVLLVVVLAIQVPRLMKSSGGSSSAPAATTTAAAESGSTTTTPASGTGTVGVAAPTGAPAPSAHTRLPNSDTAPKRTTSQLASFELFDSKDPFVQQVSEEVPAPTAPGAPAASAPAGSTATAPSSGTTGTAPQTQQQGRTLAHKLTAVIEVNGKTQTVAVGDAFPAANPTFKLASLTNGSAMIGIAGGAYASGAQTVALQTGKALTLVNTSDGVRYELRLVSTS